MATAIGVVHGLVDELLQTRLSCRTYKEVVVGLVIVVFLSFALPEAGAVFLLLGAGQTRRVVSFPRHRTNRRIMVGARGSLHAFRRGLKVLPVGGGNTLNASQAAELVSMLEPNIVIPMHYQLSDLKLQSIE